MSRALLTCLLGVELGVEEFLAVVKGVCDVLAGRWSRVLACSFLVSRASVTCLLGVEQGVPQMQFCFGDLWRCYGDGAVDGFFDDFPHFSRSSGLSRS